MNDFSSGIFLSGVKISDVQDVNPTIFHRSDSDNRFRILARFALLDSNQAKHHSSNIRSHIKNILYISKSTGQNGGSINLLSN